MRGFSQRQRVALTRAILRWYRLRGRSLPWRNITNPYRILVSEIMLQQTQVSRVLVKYPEFLRRFASIRKLAAARQRDVVVAWSGMGYNNRAVRLHRLAQIVVNKHNGRVPGTYEDLVGLPGIGRYTANALLASAFQQNVPIVDVNVRRVLSRIFWRRSTETRSESEIWGLAGKLLPTRNVYGWNQALMDLGATVCTARSPRCDKCPVGPLCASRDTIKRSTMPSAKREPSKDGIPNRIYRGRIIDVLRKRNGQGWMRMHSLGRVMHPQFSSTHRRWLDSLIVGLERDGLVRRSRTGRWGDQRITLA
jgi:A/G-specific adenine glycosylase